MTASHRKLLKAYHELCKEPDAQQLRLLATQLERASIAPTYSWVGAPSVRKGQRSWPGMTTVPTTDAAARVDRSLARGHRG